MIPFLLVRHNCIQTFDIEIIAGRNFSEEFPTDEAEAVLINETLAKQIGPNNEEIIGKIMNHDGWGKLKIIGIIRDINFESLHTSVKPLIIKLIWSSRHGALTDYIAVRLTSQNINQSIKFIEDTWNKYAPNSAFDYEFLDHRLDQFYKSERTLGYLSPIFTIIAIIISCLGLLGFIAFIAERRTKEIAIRKVFGATINIIVRFISMEFILLILIANFIAWIAIYFAVAKWLQNFAFQTKIPLMVFVIATLITFVTSFLAIIFHTLKASHTNPVDHLRYE